MLIKNVAIFKIKQAATIKQYENINFMIFPNISKIKIYSLFFHNQILRYC